jgi:hypothetical protein
MTRQKLEQLSSLLDEYYNEQSLKCDYDCYNCELGILEGYGSGHSCSIETVGRAIDNELYP